MMKAQICKVTNEFNVKAHYNDPLLSLYEFKYYSIYFPKHGAFNFGFKFWYLGFRIMIFTKIMLFNIILIIK
jgi:hypothetical protein